jgi:methyl-accepting chemotaxis protein
MIGQAFLDRLSMRQKIFLILSLSLLGVSIGFFIHTKRTYQLAKTEFEHRGQIIAQSLGNQSVYEILMKDRETLRQTIHNMIVNGTIRAAAVFDAQKSLIAEQNFNTLPQGIQTDFFKHPIFWTQTHDGQPAVVATEIIKNPSDNRPVGFVSVVLPADLLSQYKTSSAKFFLGSIIVFVIFLGFIHLIIQQTLLKPLDHLSHVAEEVANGHYEIQTQITSKDEIGKLAENLNIMIASIRRSLNEIRSRTMQLEEAQRSAEKLRQEAVQEKRYLTEQFQKIAQVIAAVQKGDFTQQIEIDRDDEVGELIHKINQMIVDLRTLIGEIRHAGEEASSASHEIAASADSLSSLANSQEDQTKEVATAVEEMSKTILESSKNASDAAEMAKRASEKAAKGEEVFHATINGMRKIAHVVQTAAEKVEGLGRSSNQIGEIVQVISDIADQTNLLALNAAIEAARAGQQGRGFAVVADEVRKLAERTTSATKEIAEMIQRIQNDTEQVVLSMKAGKDEVESNLQLADDASHSMNEILEAVKEIVTRIDHIAIASQEQSAVSEQIARNIDGISQSASKVSMASNKLAKTAEKLDHLTQHLRELVAHFQIQASRRTVPDVETHVPLN